MTQEKEKETVDSGVQNVYTGFMKTLTVPVITHIFTFDFDVVKFSVSVGQILGSILGFMGILFGGIFVFRQFGGTATALPAFIVGVGVMGLLIMMIMNKGITPRSKISSMLQEFSNEKNRTWVKVLYMGVTVDKDGYLRYEDGRVGRLFLVDGVLAKTSMITQLEVASQSRESNYIGREDSVQEDNYTLVSNLNKKEALGLIVQGVEAKRAEVNKEPSVFFEPFMALQEKMMSKASTSVLDQYTILTSDTDEEDLDNAVSDLMYSGALTDMREIEDVKEAKRVLAEIGFFAE